MKRSWSLALFLIFLISGIYGSPSPAYAFDSGSTGADGAFNPTVSTTVELPEDGILNYTTVNIPSGVTVTFKKNTANTPVYMLATGDVMISGTISVSGGPASSNYPGVGGPGGYDGGYGGLLGTYGSNGMGPKGGAGGSGFNSYCGNAGSGGSLTTNNRIIPSVGGSGGGGGAGAPSSTIGFGGGGGGGGGALLIASSTKVTINGGIYANGGAGGAAPVGNSWYSGGGGGGGSAGTIRVITDTFAGNGTVQVTPGSGGVAGCYNGSPGSAGTYGKIRFEFNTSTRTATTSPLYTFDYPGEVFYIAPPFLQITSVGGISVPQNPSANYANTDITLPANISNPVTVDVTASNIPAGSTVTIKAISQYENVVPATATSILTGTDQSSSASAEITLSTLRPSILIASVTFNVTVASNGMPLYAEGEKVAKLRVDTKLNGGTSVTYITESGREILAMNRK